ncbi:uracil-DNA glycosylase [Oenococcus sicerae]|uniref:Uracil-DNA glycosylase n=1 Tax=Oenococcus sicerae TaxID=2203724 RepID=A0AAJ1RAW5_9LACO|nr:uracil-DNA glycosylase [Oenococcus sicerae]MDN6900730.1 uracil-DNA glycosylase [Oenococcus sicerae]QAS69270.1 uracil-DNA glycosylase [Oenococcus sicerae]VDK14680.1 Uracil-DNA glycosylase [Oenococcus sicerae]
MNDYLVNLKKTDWYEHLLPVIGQSYLDQINEFLNQAYAGSTAVFPPADKIFSAMSYTSLADTKVIIVGQDPYHEAGQAQGLSFSVPDDFPAPSSLQNIHKEIASDLGRTRSSHDLIPWAKQGVLLLNSVLTVKEHQANSHAGVIWEKLTDAIIQLASAEPQPKVFILWGNFAKKKAVLINSNKDLILQSVHPSGFSANRGFFGSRPFSQTNQWLLAHDRQAIDWLA